MRKLLDVDEACGWKKPQQVEISARRGGLRLRASKESLLEQEALLATEYAPFVEERYTWSSKLHAREAARFRTAHLTGVQPEALVFPAH